jgi:hypothetical protein
MAEFSERLDDKLTAFIEEQHMFFTGTAADGSRINVSPKGMDTFRVFDAQTVGYLDLTGSGNETAAHIKNDGRLTLMFCGFESRTLIVRLYGRGEVVRPRHEKWAQYMADFDTLPGQRQIIVLHIESIQSSCGYAVPRYDYKGQRDTLVKYAEKVGADGIEQCWRHKNICSIDGLQTPMADEFAALTED